VFECGVVRGGRLGGLLQPDCVDDFGRGEHVFGLGVSVGLPGEHAEGVLFEPVVVESFSGVVVVDDPVGRFCRGAELVLCGSEELVGFGEGPEVFWPVVAGEFVLGGLVEADPHVPVDGSVVAGDVVFGREANRPVFLVDPFIDFAPSERPEVLVAVDVECADVWGSSDQVNFDLSVGAFLGWWVSGPW
jgi:hypothetical protein